MTMRIVRKLLDPSRPDAVRLRRNERMAMIHLMYAVTILEDLVTDIDERLDMVENGKDRMDAVAKLADELLNEIRKTVPENQRIGIQNIADDYEIRLVPKATPGETNVIMAKEEFRKLVDCAKASCMECTFDDDECEQCGLFQLLTSILPLDDYHALNLCPYNLGKWKN